MTPIVAQFLDYKFDVCLRYNGLDLVFSKDGVTVLSKSLAAMHLINAEIGVDTAISPGRFQTGATYRRPIL